MHSQRTILKVIACGKISARVSESCMNAPISGGLAADASGGASRRPESGRRLLGLVGGGEGAGDHASAKPTDPAPPLTSRPSPEPPHSRRRRAAKPAAADQPRRPSHNKGRLHRLSAEAKSAQKMKIRVTYRVTI